MLLVVSTAKKIEAPLESTAGNADDNDQAADNSGSSSSSVISKSSGATSNEGGETSAAATADAAAEDRKKQRGNPVLPVTVGRRPPFVLFSYSEGRNKGNHFLIMFVLNCVFI